jgi:TolB protein
MIHTRLTIITGLLSHKFFHLAIFLILSLLVACAPQQATPTDTMPPQINQPSATPLTLIDAPKTTSLPLLQSTLTPTLSMDLWTSFSNQAFAISLQYPADWQPIPDYDSPKTGETRFAAINGFFQVAAMDAASIDDAAAAEAGHRLQPYGPQPTIETLEIQGQEARLILPSVDQPTGMQYQAALIVRYPNPVNIFGTPCHFFVLWADASHIRTIAQTINFTN